jgi:hypothetical protein
MAEDRIVSVTIRDETPKETALRSKMVEFAWKSPDHLDASARQIISLVTALYALLFGVLAFASDPLPAYLTWAPVRFLGAGATAALGAALLAALAAANARRYQYSPQSLTQQSEAFEAMLRYKSTWLNVAVICFGLGVLALGTLLVGVIWFIR